MNPWYLLYCKRSEQERAEQNLKNQGVECYYPQVYIDKVRRGKRSAILEPLFPNYVFASFDPEEISFTTIRSTRGVADFVRQGKYPKEVPLELIQELRNHENSEQLQDKLSDFIKDGDTVEVVSGQFAGIEAIYKASDGEYRSILLIKLLNKDVEISAENKEIRKK